MKVEIKRTPNQSYKKMKNKYNKSLEVGHYPGTESDFIDVDSLKVADIPNVKVEDLLFIYVSGASIYNVPENTLTFCIPTQLMADKLGVKSTTSITKMLSSLVSRGLIRKTGIIIQRTHQYEVLESRDYITSHYIPIVAAISTLIPLSVKLMLVRAQLLQKPNANGVLEFNSTRHLRLITGGNSTTVEKNIKLLKKAGLLFQLKNKLAMDMEQVWIALASHELSNISKGDNLVIPGKLNI